MPNKAEIWLAQNEKFFPSDRIHVLKETVSRFPDEKVGLLYSADLKNPTTILVVSIFLGCFGVDRFMLGETGLGIGKLLTLGACGVWQIVDWFFVGKRTREVNFNRFMQLIS